MKNIFIIGLLLSISIMSYGQSVKSIEAKVVDNKIQIDFAISGLKYYQNIKQVDVFVKKEGNVKFEGPMDFISGDTEGGLRNGKHTIFWDALKEMSIGNDQLIFDIRISVEEEDRFRKLIVMLAGNDVTPLGIRFGQLGKTSWYIEARASLLATKNPQYNYAEGEIVDYDQPGYYEISGNSGWQAYSAVVGVTQQLSRKFFIYVGVGYGVENYILEIDHFSYSENASIGSDWIKYEEYSLAGVEIDAGIILKFKHFILSVGGTALDFKSFGWTAGIGYSF